MRLQRTSSTLLVLLAGVVAISLALAEGEDQAEYDKGQSAVFEGRWDDVREIFDTFRNKFPQSVHVDDAQYWLGMALYELGQSERGYEVLKKMIEEFPDSRWSDDARVLMVRCAESVLRAAAPRSSTFMRLGDGVGASASSSSGPRKQGLNEYKKFIEKSTEDSSTKVQLFAIDTMLDSNPEKAAELLPRLSSSAASSQAAAMVLDRFFGDESVKVTLEDPGLGLADDNVAVMVRQDYKVVYLTLSDVVSLFTGDSPPAAAASLDSDTIDEIRRKVLKVEESLARPASETVFRDLPGEENRFSAIIRVVDGEVHYYRNGAETTRIVVLRRNAGFAADNVRVFVETGAGIREIPLEEARAPSANLGLSDGTTRYIRAALAIIEIDLRQTTEAD